MSFVKNSVWFGGALVGCSLAVAVALTARDWTGQSGDIHTQFSTSDYTDNLNWYCGYKIGANGVERYPALDAKADITNGGIWDGWVRYQSTIGPVENPVHVTIYFDPNFNFDTKRGYVTAVWKDPKTQDWIGARHNALVGPFRVFGPMEPASSSPLERVTLEDMGPTDKNNQGAMDWDYPSLMPVLDATVTRRCDEEDNKSGLTHIPRHTALLVVHNLKANVGAMLENMGVSGAGNGMVDLEPYRQKLGRNIGVMFGLTPAQTGGTGLRTIRPVPRPAP